MIEDIVVSKDGFKIPVSYFPIDNPKGIIQIIHGSWEHKGRYYKFIEYLNSKGYTCIISDNRGHGQAITDKYPIGHMESLDESISDLYEVTKYIKERNPNIPFTLIGHSLGSVYARVYLQKHDDELTNLVLSGTVFYRSATKFGNLVVSMMKPFCHGKYGKSKKLAKMSGLNKPATEWISYNVDNLLNIKEDKLMGNSFTLGGYKVMFQGVKELGKIKHYQCKNKDLKILSITGADDPIAGGTKGLESSIKLLKKIGYQDITNIVYPHMMHEILQEKENKTVFEDIITFIER